MRAYVRLRLPDGPSVEIGHGDLIGRLWSAAVHVPDARISEAHAMVSLRGQELVLLALRGRIQCEGRRSNALTLSAGQRVELAEGIELFVEEVVLPTSVFAIEGDGLPRVVVPGVCSLLTRPRPEVVPGLVPGAAAWVWGDGEAWRLSIDGQTQLVKPGDSWVLDGRTFRGAATSLVDSAHTATRLDAPAVRPIHILASFQTVHVRSASAETLALSGLAARILSEVVAFDGPVPWEVLAREVWPDEDDPQLLRHKLDVNLSRLRSRLREGGFRPDVVRADGFGHVELFLHDGDTVENRL